jgi:hypothetical protein
VAAAGSGARAGDRSHNPAALKIRNHQGHQGTTVQ